MSRTQSWVSVVLTSGLIALPGLAFADVETGDDQMAAFTGHVKPVLYVTELKESTAFFRDVLGFAFLGFAEDADGEPYYAEMAAGRQKFGLHAPITAADRERVGRQKIYFRVTDLDAHRRRIEAAGGRPGPTRETAWMTMFVVIDPDGHEIVLAVSQSETHRTDPWSVTPEIEVSPGKR